VKINQAKKYLTGHSMGGFGAWSIGQKSAGVWAGIGIHAGALWWDNYSLVTPEVFQRMKNVPVYFVCGDVDGLYGINQTAYQALRDSGNTRTTFTTFSGGHVYLKPNLVGMNNWLKQFSLETPTGIKTKETELPSHYALANSYPNPFNPSTTIGFSLPEQAKIRVEIFNLIGQKIVTLVDDIKPAGEYKIVWNAKDLSSGIYFCRMHANGKSVFEQIQKLVLAK
jgi:hypothetical protein